MSKCLVTGVAGFIGSHLAERLVDEGHKVVGVDCFSDYYPRAIKERNLERLRGSDRFSFVEADLSRAELSPLFDGVSHTLHLAAQPGVRASWGRSFAIYTEHNVLATQRLLEAAKEQGISRFVFASSSSVYGDTPDLPMHEGSPLRPISPYGVTKLAAEHLCRLYQYNFGLATVRLRYFTVYGPRQRPDMAFARFIRAILDGSAIPVYGDGEQTRDFTFVSDAVQATVAAMENDVAGQVFNIGGGSRVTVNQAIKLLEDATGKEAIVEHRDAQAGDVRHTLADTSAARQALGFVPKVSLSEGLQAEAAWLMAQK